MRVKKPSTAQRALSQMASLYGNVLWQGYSGLDTSTENPGLETSLSMQLGEWRQEALQHQVAFIAQCKKTLSDGVREPIVSESVLFHEAP